MKVIEYLSPISRITETNGVRRLEALRDGVWCAVFTPDPIRLPEGFSTVRSS